MGGLLGGEGALLASSGFSLSLLLVGEKFCGLELRTTSTG